MPSFHGTQAHRLPTPHVDFLVPREESRWKGKWLSVQEERQARVPCCKSLLTPQLMSCTQTSVWLAGSAVSLAVTLAGAWEEPSSSPGPRVGLVLGSAEGPASCSGGLERTQVEGPCGQQGAAPQSVAARGSRGPLWAVKAQAARSRRTGWKAGAQRTRLLCQRSALAALRPVCAPGSAQHLVTLRCPLTEPGCRRCEAHGPFS